MTDENFNLELAPQIQHAQAVTNHYHFVYRTVGEMLGQVPRLPDSEVLVFRDDAGNRQTYCWEDFQKIIRKIAFSFSEELNVKKGDRIAILSGNRPETVFLYCAAWLLGVTVVPINVTEDDERIEYILKHSGARYALCPDDQYERVPAGLSLRSDVWLDSDFLAKTQSLTGMEEFGITPDTEALLVYTSGTTGAPKGVILEHRNLIADAQGIAAWHGLTEQDRAMVVLPLHHVNGIVVTLVTPLLAGGSVVLNKKFSASRFWKTVAEEKCTWSSVVPTILAFLCETKPEGWSTPKYFRHFICGAGPLTTDLAKRFDEKFGVRVVHGYGLSETTCYSCFLPTDLAQKDYAHWMWECGFPSIGIPLPENELAIHDENGNALPAEVRGEIVIRGVNVMRAYFKRPDANATAFTHGWFRSGDEGFWRFGTDGKPYFFITGRLKELIIRGGVNYSPLEIDEVLSAIPGIKAAMAVGFENNFYGEEIGAYVQREPGAALTETEILAACRETLPFNKAPKVVVFGEEFPVTSTGKYQRSKLKPLFAAWRDAEFRK